MATGAFKFNGLLFVPQSSCPVAASSNGLWVDTAAANVLKFRQTDNSDVRLVSKSQTPTFSATIAINPALGEIVLLTLTANLGAWTISNGVTPGDLCTLVFIQDGTGSRLIGTPPAIIKWLPTTYLGATHANPTLTTTPSKRDSTFLQWDSTNWVEFGRSFNN